MTVKTATKRVGAFVKENSDVFVSLAIVAATVAGAAFLATKVAEAEALEEAEAEQARQELFEMYADAREYRRLQQTANS